MINNKNIIIINKIGLGIGIYLYIDLLIQCLCHQCIKIQHKNRIDIFYEVNSLIFLTAVTNLIEIEDLALISNKKLDFIY